MRARNFFKLLAVIFLFTAVLASARAQTLPPSGALEQTGMLPYVSYHGGDIDSVGLSNGTLSLHAPFLSYPQQGNVHLSFDLYYNNMPQHLGEFCTGNPNSPTCYWEWGYAPGGSILPLERGDPFVGWAQQAAAYATNIKATVGEGEGSYTVWYGNWSIQTADGTSHILGNLGTMTRIGGTGHNSVDEYQYNGPFESLDATAWRYSSSLTSATVQYGGPAPSTGLIGPDGINYGSSSEQDTNGNKITLSSGVFTDTLSRQIPAPPTSTTASNTSTSACPQGPLPIAFAVLWSPPEPSGTSGGYTFCYVKVAVNSPPVSAGLPTAYTATLLQSIVLPNGQSWNFEFNDPGDGSTYNGSPVNYGTLTQVTLPTGGTIAYTYTTVFSAGSCHNSGRWVATRTVSANDNTGSHQWTYAYTPGSSTKVTDPLGNYTVHTFGSGGPCTLYETQTQQYQNGGTTPLKTVSTAYAGNIGGNWNDLVNVVPTQIETIWPNNQTSETTFSYDSGFSYLDYAGISSHPGIYGKALTKSEYDYGNNAPGALLRTTNTQYEALINSAYLASNLMNLPSSVQINNSSGTKVAYTTYAYDSATTGNLTSVSKWLNTTGGYLTNSNTYCSTGLLQTSTDPKLNKTTYTYTPACQGASPTSITNALNQTTSYTYDSNTGLRTSIKDPNLQTTSFTYDNMWRLASVTYPDGGSSTITRQETTFPNTATLTKAIITTPAVNYVTTNTFDGLGRVTESLVTDPQGNIETDTTYDADGRKSTVSNPYRHTTDSTYGITTYQYDALSRTTLVIPPDGSATSDNTSTQYCGSTTLVTDQAGHWRRSTADGLGRLIEVDEPNSTTATVNVCPGTGEPIWVTTYGYDALNNLTSVVQGGTHNRSFVFDSLKRLTSSTNPEAGTVTYTYDADSNVLTKKDARTFTITYGYDVLNRMTGKTYSNGDPAVSYSYDQTGCLTLSVCYNIGRRTAMTDAGGSESWAYDQMGRELAEQRITNSITKSTSYSYNLDGTLATLTYPSGRVITYTTDAVERPSEAVDVTNSVNYATGICSNRTNSNGVCYASQGAVSQMHNGADLITTYIYDERLQPCWIYATTSSALATSTKCTGTMKAGTVLDLKYNFALGTADNGNVVGITNNVDTTRSQSFTYDQVNRIVTGETASTTGANCWGESYTYDQWTNLTAIGVASSSYNGCTQESLSVTALSNNQLSATGFSYDASGNILTDGHNTYGWNAESEIKSAGGVNYTYDGDGDRVEKSNGKIYWYGAGSEILDESDLSGNITDEYIFFGGKRIARRDSSGNVIYYAADHLGTSRVITNSTGAILDQSDFYPFGGERILSASSGNTYKFEGKERDTETNNDDFGARYYSSQFGRWLSPDWSAMPVPVPYANLSNPQTLNLYAMVSDNPETFADLDGHYLMAPNDYSDFFRHGKCEDQPCMQNKDNTVPNSTAAPIRVVTNLHIGIWARIKSWFSGSGEREPNPYVTAGTDVIGLAGIFVRIPIEAGAVIAGTSIVNDRNNRANAALQVFGLWAPAAAPTAVMGAFIDVFDYCAHNCGPRTDTWKGDQPFLGPGDNGGGGLPPVDPSGSGAAGGVPSQQGCQIQGDC